MFTVIYELVHCLAQLLTIGYEERHMAHSDCPFRGLHVFGVYQAVISINKGI